MYLTQILWLYASVALLNLV